MSGKLSVLLAEDEDMTRLMVSEWISSWGYEVEAFKDGDSAQERLSMPDSPRLAVLDWLMPGKTGVELCRALKKKRPQIYFIVLTSKSQEKDYIHALEDGAHAFQTKPISPAILRSQIEVGYRLILAEDELMRQERAIRLKCYGALANLAETRDDLTGEHMRRIGIFSRLIAESLGAPPRFCEDLEVFAPLHDIGKVGIPDTILMKPQPLTLTEHGIMQGHTTMGNRILSDVPTMEMGAVIARSHHEKWAGGGYPDNLSGEAIPLEARIVSMVDVYDALRSRRPYKEPWTHEKALELIRHEREQQFDPQIVDIFVRRAEEVRELRILHCDSSEENL